jgi:hypothetical protein
MGKGSTGILVRPGPMFPSFSLFSLPLPLLPSRLPRLHRFAGLLASGSVDEVGDGEMGVAARSLALEH